GVRATRVRARLSAHSGLIGANPAWYPSDRKPGLAAARAARRGGRRVAPRSRLVQAVHAARSALGRAHLATTRARPTSVRRGAAVRGSLLLAIAAIVAAALAGPVLAVETEPKITAQPKSVTVEEGSAATFKSTASGGTPAPSVQWEVSTNGGSTWGPDTTDGG